MISKARHYFLGLMMIRKLPISVLVLILVFDFGNHACGHELTLSVQNDRFFLNEVPFRMWGIRTASAIKDQYTTNHLIDQLDSYKDHGVNTVTVFYMGSSGGNYDPFSHDGLSIESGHQKRMEQLIDAAKERGMVVIVGIFYQHAPFGLKNAEAVRNAVCTVTNKLKKYKNIIINIANEQNSHGWKDTVGVFDFRNPGLIIELCRIVHQEDPSRLVGGGGYNHKNNVIIGKSQDVDILLFDTLGGKKAGGLYKYFVNPLFGTESVEESGNLYKYFVHKGIASKPIVNVELFGLWSKNQRKGVYSYSKKQKYFNEIDSAIEHPGLYVFFHSNSWCQEKPIRYDLAGQGTKKDPGIQWYFDYLKKKLF